jgi:hypothetical protein
MSEQAKTFLHFEHTTTPCSKWSLNIVCGKRMKTNAGLAKHMKSSKYCIALKNQMDEAANRGVDSKATGKDKFDFAKKPEHGTKRRAALEVEDAKQPAKIRMILDKATMQRLEMMFTGDDQVLLRSLTQKQLQNLGQQQEDSMGWLPFKKSFEREDFATFQANQDTTSEDGLAAGCRSSFYRTVIRTLQVLAS